MKPKIIKLIRILSDYTEFITATKLAANMDVSTRSIKSYIQEINSFYPDTIESSREGYRINRQTAKQILDQAGTHIPQSSQERVVYMINRLIKSETSANTYDLCDEMYISYSTIKNDLQTVKSKLKKFDLQLISIHDNLSIAGLEKNKRRLLSSILYDESNVNFVNLETIQNIFPEINIELIKDRLLEIFDQYHYFVNDYSLINLVLHITIAIDRMQNNNINTDSLHNMPPISSHEYQLAQNIARSIEQDFPISYNQPEVYELALLLISRATAIDYQSITITNLEEFIGRDCFLLVNELISSVSAYIAFHLGSTLEAQKNLSQKVTAGLYCPSYYNTNVKLTDTISRHFSTELLITSILTEERDLGKCVSNDMVLSTVPLNTVIQLPVTMILSSRENIKRLIQAEHYEVFIDMLVQLVE